MGSSGGCGAPPCASQVAYHNSVHAADVTHALHWLLTSEALSLIPQEEPLLMLTCLVSAIVHDLGHDGYNNAFHINSNSEFARTHSYTSPLERHHLASANSILSTSLLSGMALAERKQVQGWLRELVLATDFVYHMDVINQFKAMVELRGAVASSSSVAPLASLEGDEKILALKMAIKTADLGYLTKGASVVLPWTEKVLEEFFIQGDTEKQLGLPVSFGCDRENFNLPQSQIGFYNFMVQPLYTAMGLLVPIEPQMANLTAMREHWEGMKKGEGT
jgi:cAMP-specific phosphodiesterase 4